MNENVTKQITLTVRKQIATSGASSKSPSKKNKHQSSNSVPSFDNPIGGGIGIDSDMDESESSFEFLKIMSQKADKAEVSKLADTKTNKFD